MIVVLHTKHLFYRSTVIEFGFKFHCNLFPLSLQYSNISSINGLVSNRRQSDSDDDK